jgi:hypothetical protein
MSKKNIIDKQKVDSNTIRLTFENPDGIRVYEFKGSSMRAIQRGVDPAQLTGGRLVSFISKKK